MPATLALLLAASTLAVPLIPLPEREPDLSKEAVARLLKKYPKDEDALEQIFLLALHRKPTDAEKKLARDTLGSPVKPEGVQDVLWAIAMLPEFQLVN